MSEREQTTTAMAPLVEALQAMEPRLDDMRRARIQGRLGARLDEIDAERAAAGDDGRSGDGDGAGAGAAGMARRRQRVRFGLALIGTAAAAAAIAVAIARGGSRSSESKVASASPDAGATVGAAPDAAAVAPPPAPSAPSAPQDQLAILEPYLFSGDLPAAPAAQLGAEARLTVGPGEQVQAAIAGHGAFTLIGPAALEVIAADDQHVELRLERGTLVGSYGGGGRLQIHSPGAITTVVETVFAIETAPASSRVAVARGAATVDAGGQARPIASGESWRTGDRATGPVPPPLAARVDDHEAGLHAPVGAWGVLVVDGNPRRERVWLGDVLLGETPLVARVPIGAASVRVQPRSGAPGISLGTEVRAGESATLRYGIDAPTSLGGGAAAGVPARIDRMPAVPSVEPDSSASRRRAANDADAGAGAASAPATADEAYREAERILRDGDPAAARTALADLIAQHPDDPLAASARYELAQLAFRTHRLDEAAAHLDALIASSAEPALEEPARYLRCRVDLARANDPAAARCITAFRDDFPRSPHDAELLAALATIRAQDGCEAAAPLFSEYVRRHPRGPWAGEAKIALARCSE